MKNFSRPLLVIGSFAMASLSLAANTPKKGEISMEKAQEIANQKVSGKILSGEYEHEKGQNVYSFDISGKDGKIHEVLVSAKSGKIVSSTIETPSQEAAEKD